ncbi:IS3 family transposase [Myxococcus sp. MxC21-1]|uniref:IS3 family transposase n=1 Tax=Myxococcus sp. MxC21-1 TaxID=3041439 RepID=UPI0029308AA1|nr:IS3 family transposase [Myxococcus sp. MxC21-1]WNZ59067.1 IS3 family transposase [Myxococcus sp. MxC21-1]WNZ59110.1 IS3 family transposase [Myxococcus sp. MxC21-1]
MSAVVEEARVRETEVEEKARRRGFTAEYKLRVLAEADRCTQPGEVGALLRREGLYSSLLSAWRRQREAGELSARSPKKRGPPAKVPDASARRVAELEKQLARAQVRLKRAEALLDLQKSIGNPGSGAAEARRGALMGVALEAVSELGVAPVCPALGLPRATYYRRARPKHGPARRSRSPRALAPEQRAEVLAALHEPRFQDAAPAEVYAQLLDEGRYLCSERTMYRVLAENHQVRERRNQLRHPNHPVPQLHATKPNELWSWDITKLHGPSKWTYFYLYVVLDVFSRYVVGWMVAHRESATLAKKLLALTCERQGVVPGQLTIHADRGSSMTSKPVALLMADLGVTKTHSRPYVSNDNPFSEAHFKTMKYRPDFPEAFGCIQDARGHFSDFFGWYNNEHHHGGLGLLTPYDVHLGLAAERLAARAAVLAAAYAAHPERFPRGAPMPKAPPTSVWINDPARLSASLKATQ